MTINSTTNDHSVDAPLSTTTDTFFSPPPIAPITATNNPCPTPATSVATSDYLSPASSTDSSTVDFDHVHHMLHGRVVQGR
ncbi:unnamed protein product [Schistocephalus solidus]|uniref:Uncharacterized protein n=1 Tax=Schistocephalus solidus TaxID=70667 RepID=A0A183S9F8_SCHSO|nr:unnamed protein product [Schistocephalus solidus]